MANRLSGEMTKATKKAVVDIDPRSALIDLNVQVISALSPTLVEARNALQALELVLQNSCALSRSPRRSVKQISFATVRKAAGMQRKFSANSL
jgi:hypothetical protein